MNKEEFLKEKDLLLNSIENNTKEHWENYYKGIPIECIYDDLVIDINEIKRLTEENEKLKDNWNKLKKWLEKELGDRINPNKDKWLTGVYDAYRETIDKMQELEQGSDK